MAYSRRCYALCNLSANLNWLSQIRYFGLKEAVSQSFILWIFIEHANLKLHFCWLPGVRKKVWVLRKGSHGYFSLLSSQISSYAIGFHSSAAKIYSNMSDSMVWPSVCCLK
jgi:hypothetical protein